jgi:hypothetical protein
MSERCKHGKYSDNPCWECDEERGEPQSSFAAPTGYGAAIEALRAGAEEYKRRVKINIYEMPDPLGELWFRKWTALETAADWLAIQKPRAGGAERRKAMETELREQTYRLANAAAAMLGETRGLDVNESVAKWLDTELAVSVRLAGAVSPAQPAVELPPAQSPRV